MSEAQKRLLAAQHALSDQRYAAKPRYYPLTITSIDRTEAGAPVLARGTIGNTEGFAASVVGRAVEEQEVIEVRATDDGALEYVRHISSPHAGAGLVLAGVTPEPPTWGASPYSVTQLLSSTDILWMMAVTFDAPADKYEVAGFIVSYQFQMVGETSWSAWIDQVVPGLPTSSFTVVLSRGFAPSTTVNVKARSTSTATTKPSEETEERTFVLPADTTSPGSCDAIAVSTAVAGQLVFTASGAVNANLFDHWRYEVADTDTGPADYTIDEAAQAVFQGAAGSWYVRARPVSKNGVLGTLYPRTDPWYGPFTLAVAAAPHDTTAPAAWDAPTVVLTRVTPDTGGERARATVSFPARAGGFEADYDRTILRGTDNATPTPHYVEIILQYKGTVHEPQTIEPLYFGTWSFTLQAVDRSGNRSVASAAGVSNALASSGAPAAAGNVTTVSASLAIKLAWTKPANALAVKIHRATSSGGAGDTVIDTVDSTQYVDAFAASSDADTHYWYKIQGVNIAGDGTVSGTWVEGVVGKYDGKNLVVNSVTANTLEATLNMTSKAIQTAASGARVVLDGTNNRLGIYSASALLAYLDGAVLRFLRDGVTTHPRTQFDENGIYVYDDSGILLIALTKYGVYIYNTSGGVQQIFGRTGGGVAYGSLDITGSQYQQWSWVQAANDYQYSFLTRVQSGGDNLGTGILGYQQSPGGPVPHRFVIGTSGDPLNQTTNYVPADSVEFNGGNVIAGAAVYVPTVYLGPNTNHPATYNNSAGAFDFDAPVRSVVGGQAFKWNHDGSNAHVNWSAGGLYIGWYTNPSNFVGIGNGAEGYGPITASAFTTSSDRRFKRDLTPLERLGARFDRLKPTRYTRTDDPHAREVVGLIADEVAPHFPEAVVDLPPLPPAEDGTVAARPGGQGVDLQQLLTIAIQALQETRAELAGALVRLTALEGRRP